GQPPLQVRPEIVPDLILPGIAQTTGDSPPHDPEFRPHTFLLMRINTRREQRSRLLGSPFIQRITESGAQCVARELKPDSLVIWRTAAFFRSRKQCAP